MKSLICQSRSFAREIKNYYKNEMKTIETVIGICEQLLQL